jgi:alpha-amylase
MRPLNAITLVTNLDTQTGQTVETPVDGFFKPLAYALILLRSEGWVLVACMRVTDDRCSE